MSFKNKKVLSPRHLAFKSMTRLNEYIRQRRIPEAIQAVVGPDVQILSAGEKRVEFYADKCNFKFPKHQDQEYYSIVRDSHDDDDDAAVVQQNGVHADGGEASLGEKQTRTIARSAARRPEPYNVLLRTLSSHGLYKECFKLYSEMLQNRVRPSGETFTSLFEACSRNLSHIQKEKGVVPSAMSNTAYRKAVHLFSHLDSSPSSTQRSSQLNRYHVNAFLKCAVRVRDYHTIFDGVYKRMNIVNSQQRSREILSLVDYLETTTKSGNNDAAQIKEQHEDIRNRLLQSLSGNSLSSNTILSDCDIDDKNVDLLQDDDNDKGIENSVQSSQLCGIRPDVITYSIILNACSLRGGDAAFEDAKVLWKHIHADLAQSKDQTLKLRLDALQNFSHQGTDQKSEKQQKVTRSQNKNNKSTDRRREIVLDQQKYKTWQEIEQDNQNRFSDKYPIISVDCDLINSMLMVCKNAQALGNITYGLMVAQQEFGQAFQWQQIDRQCGTKLSQYLPRQSVGKQSSDINQQSLQSLSIAPILPNSKTLMVLLQILKKIGADGQDVAKFYRYMTSGSINVVVKPDDALTLYAQRCLKQVSEQ
ncbi:hypothetical protein MIR68_010613 [Amoeboaphelidium protococcarum]|nr:hypothetical protein MIR68_010613 [Amoeboaphelidium protococcarum]